jgi:predicted transcriptional regulator
MSARPRTPAKPKRNRAARSDVRRLLGRGWTPQMIAAELGVTTQDIYKHMAAIREAAERSA